MTDAHFNENKAPVRYVSPLVLLHTMPIATAIVQQQLRNQMVMGPVIPYRRMLAHLLDENVDYLP